MPSTTSGTTTFSLDVDEIIDEAISQLGGEFSSGIEMQKARRTLNLILIELQNKNVPLFKISTTTQVVTSGDSTYSLSAGVSDVLTMNIKRDDTETPLLRYGVKEWNKIADKTQSGKPTTFMIERGVSGITVNLWPVPENSTDTLVIRTIQRIEDVTASYQKLDVPYRFYPLIIKWLRYELSLTRQGIPLDIRQELKMKLDECMLDTFEEDRERVNFTIYPGGLSGR